MVESGVTEGGENCQFSLSGMNTTTIPQHKHEASSEKATIFKVIPDEKQQLLEDKDADNITEVLGKSFNQ